MRQPDPQRQRAGWLLLAAIGGLAVLALPFFAQRVYVADDLGEFHLPVRDFYARQLAAGESFDWMPSLYGGFYVAGEGQLGGYHPWHWLLYRTLPLGAAFDLELLASYPFLFAGMYLLLRRLVERRDAALVGSLTFTFSGFCLLHFLHPNAIAVVAHLPWLLWTLDIALRSPSPWGRAGAEAAFGLLTASQLLLGYPQYVWFSLLAEGAFVVYRVVTLRPSVGRFAGLAVALVAGVLIGAVQWLPTWHLLVESVREAPSTAFANTGSMPLLNLVQLLAPYLFVTRVVGQNTHELGLYIGAVPLVLCVWLLVNRRELGAYRPLVHALLVALVLATLLAAGEYGGLYRLQSLVPLANRFRFPCRAIVLVQLCTAMLAAISAALLFARSDAEQSLSRSSVCPMLITVGAAVALAFLGPIVWPEFVSEPLLVWAGPVLIGIAAILVLLVERGVPGGSVLLALFLASDLVIYGASYSIFGRTAELHEYVAGIPRPPDDSALRIAVLNPNGVRAGDRMLLAGIERIDGYAGLEPAKRLDYRQRRPLELAGVGWILLSEDGGVAKAPRWQSVAPTGPRVRLAGQSLPPEKLAELGSPDWDTVVTEPYVPLKKSDPGKAVIEIDRPGRLEVKVNAPGPQVLVTTESFDSGWSATQDDRPVAVVRVNGDFLGCAVAPGVHRVKFAFRPRARQLGGGLALLGLALLGVAACLRTVVSRPA